MPIFNQAIEGKKEGSIATTDTVVSFKSAAEPPVVRKATPEDYKTVEQKAAEAKKAS